MRFVVAMSGGVDSSTVAGLLHQAGHDVIGVTLQLYDHGVAMGRKGACCAGQDIRDARRVADHLGIPHYVVGSEKIFATEVIGNFVDSYATGETPVPCIRCNQFVKFPYLTELARGLGADRLATGHYARRINGAEGPELHRAADSVRDQSWFLFAITQAELAICEFPLGTTPDKRLVRATAARLGLQVAGKADSQDICFVPPSGYAPLVKRLRPDAAVPGSIVSQDGRVLARHEGIAHYTVGQGKRLGAATMDGGRRQIVVSAKASNRHVVVGPRGSGTDKIYLCGVNWLVQPPRTTGVYCQVKLRAQEEHRSATVYSTSEGAEVRLDLAGLATPGQACVFYDGERILGGGFMRRARHPDETSEFHDKW